MILLRQPLHNKIVLLKNSSLQYGLISKFFHWVLAFFIIGMLILGFLMDNATNSLMRGTLYNFHKLLGLVILILMLLRATWAATNVKPILYFTHFHEKVLERLVHYALYIAVFLMPISGWVMSSAAGHPPRYGNFVLMLPIAKSKTVASYAGVVHYWVSITLITLIIIHVIAGFFHFYVKKDDVLQRMLP